MAALAECMDCPELKAAAEDLVQLHFTEVYRLDEFLTLDVTQLTHLLHQDKLTVRAEAQADVCHRQQHMVEVLGCVRFPLLSKTFLSKTVQAEPLIQDNTQCLKMVMGGMRYHLLSPEDREDLGESSRPRRKKHHYRIALFGGSQPQSCRYFNPKPKMPLSLIHPPASNNPLARRLLRFSQSDLSDLEWDSSDLSSLSDETNSGDQSVANHSDSECDSAQRREVIVIDSDSENETTSGDQSVIIVDVEVAKENV